MSASVKFFLHFGVEHESFTAKTMPDQIAAKFRFVTVLLADWIEPRARNAQPAGSVQRQCAEYLDAVFLLCP
jgi:hypothetical protein